MDIGCDFPGGGEFVTKPDRSIIASLLLKYNPFLINASLPAVHPERRIRSFT
jgi:hypothetical protein